MAHIEFLDETLRDGQQSLWGMRMQAGMALPVTPLLDRTGFRVIDLTGSSIFEVLIKYCHENPWEGLDLLVQSMPRTRVRGGMRSNASVTFGVTPDALMDIWMRQLNAHGVRSFWIYDVLFNIEKMHRLAKLAKEYGSEVAGAVMFTLSPVHTDAFFAEKAGALAASPDVDTILLYDTAGVLDRERISTLIPAIRNKIGDKPLELHSNNLLGTSGKAYLDAVEFGVTILHTASRPMANGPSVPSTESVAENLELLGHTHGLNKSLFSPVAERFRSVGRAAGFLVDQYSEYSVLAIQHQIPGGMVGTLKAQLVQHGMPERFQEVLEETARVRRELGYPGMATPFSQLVGTLAVLNIITGERYSVIPDEVIQYAAGYYGVPVAPIDKDILDRIMSSPHAASICATSPEEPSAAELHKRYGTDDDDELILRALLPEDALRKMRDAGPVKMNFSLLSSAELEQVYKLLKIANLPLLQYQSAKMNVTLRRHAS